MIPKIIWQTYKSKQPPIVACKGITSWLRHNPNYKWYYFDDKKCDQFIKDHFSNEFYNMYQSLPFGVMRSDVWRIAVVYIYGGVYTDLDTICNTPISQWMSTSDKLVVSAETSNSLANYTFAAIPKHPALLNALNLCIRHYNSPDFMSKDTLTPIQNFGASAFSEGVLSYYGLKDSFENNTTNLEKAKQDHAKIFTYKDFAFTPVEHEARYVYHQTASIFWKHGYESWRKEQDRFLENE